MDLWYTYTGPIKEDIISNTIAWLSNQVSNSQVEKLKFFISSKGGDGDSAVRLYDYLKALPFEVETVGFGQVDSAANIIFLAGRKRFAMKGCRFILHEGTFTVGNPTSALHVHEQTLEYFREIHKRQVKIISQETKKEENKIKDILRKGGIFSAEEAKKFGIVHEVIKKLPPKQNQPQARNS